MLLMLSFLYCTVSGIAMTEAGRRTMIMKVRTESIMSPTVS
jgi:hypothetical protein